jgi:serine protease AprX
VHSEFRGDPEQVKQLFLKNARDLGRDRAFQGAGLVDLLGTLMAV